MSPDRTVSHGYQAVTSAFQSSGAIFPVFLPLSRFICIYHPSSYFELSLPPYLSYLCIVWPYTVLRFFGSSCLYLSGSCTQVPFLCFPVISSGQFVAPYYVCCRALLSCLPLPHIYIIVCYFSPLIPLFSSSNHLPRVPPRLV